MKPLARHERASALLLIVSVPVLASPAPSPEQPDVAVPPVRYHSAFDAYPAFRPAKLADWRGVNDTVRQLGGHQGHMSTPTEPLGEHASQGHEHGGRP
ncbi:MAG: hypothetical protein K6346_01970 [Halothiobacillaceae bacterium]